MDNIELNEIENKIIAISANSDVTKRKMKMIVIFSVTAIVSVIFLMYLNVSPKLIGSITILYMVITAVEKLGYGQAVLIYKSVIQKLINRIEELEKST